MVRAWAGKTFRSLRVYNYRVWTAGSLVSNIGSWMQVVAQSWLVLTELTHNSASALGLVTALQFLPQMLFLPLTGLAADRFDQRRLMMITQTLMAIFALTLGTLVITGVVTLGMVYILAFLAGTAAAFDAPARQAFVSELVEPDDLANAVALNATTFNGARMFGPAVAGFTIAAFGTGWAFLLNGVSFIAVIISLLMLRQDQINRSERTRGVGGYLEGFKYVWRRMDLRILMIMLLVFGTFGMNYSIWIAAMAVKQFHTGAHGFGSLSSAMAVGTIIGGLMAAGRVRPGFPHIVGGAAVFSAAALAAALAPNYWFFALALVPLGAAIITLLNSSNAVTQLTTEPAMRGRVLAIRLAIALGGTPVGALIVGCVSDRWGARVSMGIGVAAGLVTLAIGLAYLYRTRADQLAPT